METAQAFLQGYLYVFAQTYGTVISVNSTGAPDALGDSLGPSDMCPAFVNVPANNVTDCKSQHISVTFYLLTLMSSRQYLGSCRR